MLKIATGSLLVAALFAVPVSAAAQRQVIGNDLGKCASGHGPAVLVTVNGFESSTGKIRVQSYPATRDAWLEKGQWINRIESPIRLSGNSMKFCVPVPAAGKYGIAVRHDKNGNGKTDISQDGGGFSNNPSVNIFNLGKPSVTKAAFDVGSGVTAITINLKYM